ncbi:MAG: hypothetical protein JXI43_09495 [Tissierellales bacterium]|nr:hypothetical protein [Tissierellales bacterium]
MKNKISTWILIGVLVGIILLCAKGWKYCDNHRKSIISKSSSKLLTEAKQTADYTNFEKTIQNTIAEKKEYYDSIFVKQQINDFLKITDLLIVKPLYIQINVSDIRVGGFNGLSMPRIYLEFDFESINTDSVKIGQQFVFYSANIKFTEKYWERSLLAPYKELERLVVENDSINIIEAKYRINQLKEREQEYAGIINVEGRASFQLTSTSGLKWSLYRFLSILLRSIAIIVGIFTLIILKTYLMSLKAGDIET